MPKLIFSEKEIEIQSDREVASSIFFKKIDLDKTMHFLAAFFLEWRKKSDSLTLDFNIW